MKRAHSRHPYRRHSSARTCLCGALVLIYCWGAAAPTFAQSLWEVSPYRMEVWVALEPHPQLDRSWQEQLPEELQRLAENRIGAVWSLTARAVPAEYLGDLLRGSRLDLEQLRSQQPQLVSVDKLMLVLVQADSGGYRISVRESDMSTPQWSPTQSVTVM